MSTLYKCIVISAIPLCWRNYHPQKPDPLSVRSVHVPVHDVVVVGLTRETLKLFIYWVMVTPASIIACVFHCPHTGAPEFAYYHWMLHTIMQSVWQSILFDLHVLYNVQCATGLLWPFEQGITNTTAMM